MLLELATVCLITMSGGAPIAGRRSLAWVTGVATPALEVSGETSACSRPVLSNASLYVLDGGTSSGTDSGPDAVIDADAGKPTIRTSTPTPIHRGAVDQFLRNPELRDAVDALLAEIGRSLPGYPSVLEVIVDPDGGAESLMLNVFMSPTDEGASAFVDTLIDDHWLALAPQVRATLGVGRELVSVG